MKPIVGVVMGSDSDLPIMQSTLSVLEEFGVPYEVRVMSAHRVPVAVADFAVGAATSDL